MEGSLEEILVALSAMWPGLGYILMALGLLVVVGRIYVSVTPSQEDDEWFARLEEIPVLGALLKILVKFSPVQRANASEPKPLKKKR